MAYHDKLRQIVTDDFDLSYDVHITKNEPHSNALKEWKKQGFYCDHKSKKIYLNPDHIPLSKKGAFRELLIEYIDEGEKLLESHTRIILEELYEFTKRRSHQATLSFFEPIIPYSDYEALSASYFLADKFNNREDISEYKRDIRYRHGDRGNNISNLCTAGYFEHFLPELYNSYNDKSEFIKIYDEIVNNSMMALFVNQQTKATEISGIIKQKIASTKKYGLKFVHIHAISKTNIKKIKQCLASEKEFFKFYEKNIYENKDKSILILELILK